MALRVTEEDFKSFLVKLGGAPSVTTPPRTVGKSKYGSIRTEIDGRTFDSKGEAARYCELKAMQQAGLITDLQDHVPFPITIGEHHICTYIADFVYLEGGCRVVEDFKGVRTKEYSLKKKLLRATWGIAIKEVRKRQ